MEKDIREALQKAIEAGGKKVKPAQLTALTKKAQEAFLAPLVEAGYLEKDGKNFNVTDAGRQAWEMADPAGAAAWHENNVIAFLKLVAGKAGKALSAKEQGTTSSRTLEDAQTRKLVQAGSKAGAYDLLPAGKLLLLAERPIAEQADELRKLTADLQQRFDGLSKAAEKQLKSVLGEEGTSLAEATRQRLDAVIKKLDTELATLATVPEAARIGREARERVEKIAAEAVTQIEQRQGQATQLDALIRQTQQSLETQRQEQKAFEAVLQPYFERLEKLAHERPPTKPEPANPSEPTDEQLWEATRTAHAELRKRGSVKIPELTDAVRGIHPALRAERYHRLLQQWHEADRLNLEAANSANLELRASEGISSPRGLLFYVHLTK